MNVDALTLAAICSELQPLVGGRVQRVVRPSSLSIAMEIYTGERRHLLLSAETQQAALLVTEERPRRGTETASPLQLLLRKYVEGARVTSLTQTPYDRVVTLAFAGEHGSVVLVCELMGRLSNLVLVSADGTVLDAAKRVPASVNRYRTVLPGRPYTPPPPGDKLRPPDLTTDALAHAVAAAAEVPLWRHLVDLVFGVSPTLAREIVHRAVGDAGHTDSLTEPRCAEAVRVLQALWHMPEDGAWAPSVAWTSDSGLDADARHALAVAPYALTHLGEYTAYKTMQEALAAFEAASAGPPEVSATSARSGATDGYAGARQRVRGLVARACERQQARLTSLRDALVSADELESLRWRGAAILAVADRIAPGQDEVTVAPYVVSGLEEDRERDPVSIPLKARLSAAENAQEWFRQYRKRRDAVAQVPELIAQTEAQLAYLAQLDADADLAADRPALDQVEAALSEVGYTRTRQPSEGGRTARSPSRRARDASEPLREHAPDGTLVLVGRNSAQNQTVTFHLAGPDDLWLHAHGAPGAHVIVRGGWAVSEETLAYAAGLAARHSAARHQPRVQVDCTTKRLVRPQKGARPGMVTYRSVRTLTVELDGVAARGSGEEGSVP